MLRSQHRNRSMLCASADTTKAKTDIPGVRNTLLGLPCFRGQAIAFAANERATEGADPANPESVLVPELLGSVSEPV